VTYSIFVAHPSALLTDWRPHGDGLLAHAFITRLAGRGHRVHVAAPEAALRDELPPNVQLHIIGTGRLAEPLSRLRYMWHMRRLFMSLRRRTRFDLVHQLNPVDTGLTLALVDTKLPVVLGPYVPAWPEWSDPGGWSASARLQDRVNSIVRGAQQRRATTVLLSTPAAASKLGKRLPRQLLVRELSAGIDERLWTPGSTDAARRDVLFLANLEYRKGIFVLLDAFARVVARLPDARLLIAGGGTESERVRSVVARSAVRERVELIGTVNRDQAPQLMRRCTVFCAPALGEPFGLTALEAMACAKPIVATDAGGLRYLVEEQGGHRVVPADPEALATALCEVLIDPERQRRMGAHNRALIERRYTWTRMLDRLEELYEEAIGAAPAR
jgi:L-malate glycosyltransferase